MIKVTYLRDVYPDVEYKKAPVRRRGLLQQAPGQGADGYGRKIHTDYMAIFNGKSHRIYCCCISNVGSLYVLEKGKWLHVGDHDIPDNIRYGEAT